jgi:wyosine [tRNA(Phe)-imidazoG37] synthetase (radical SAM superfamily)
MVQQLTITEHSRDVAGLKYVYPVLSRRAGGLSIGINFNSNNACNWRCVYCQVPGLQRGTAPELDFELLADELNFFLHKVLFGDFYERFNVPEHQRVIKDIAISGNGEPTSLNQFDKAVELIAKVAGEKGVLPDSHFVLITNGSLLHQAKVQRGLKQLNRFGGEVWFKFDSATQQGRKQINQCSETNQKVFEHLRISTSLCKTKLQTCLLNYKQVFWTQTERNAYLQILQQLKGDCLIDEVMLYSIARQSQQPEAKYLQKIPRAEMLQFAEQIQELGYKVSVSD